MRIIKKILKIVGIALLILIGVPLIIGQVLRWTASVEPPPGDLVDVGGYKLHINCVGPEGKTDNDLPTVVVEAGAGVSSPIYHWIQDGVSKTTKVCVYDRAGLGWSEESGLPRDSKTVTTALHTLLDKANVKRPFVFVGHSIAGLYMRDYVERYPDEVIGLAFLDPSHPEQNARFGLTQSQRDEQMDSAKSQIFVAKLLMRLGVMEVFNPSIQGDLGLLPENIKKQVDYLSKQTTYLDTVLLETADFEQAAEQAAQNKSLGNRPIVVISATKPMQPGILPEGVSAEKFQANFVKMHKEITALSTKGKHVEINTADHMSLITNKENAAKAVSYILEVVKDSAKIENNSDSDSAPEKKAETVNK